ncbi:MAG: enoyl-ACP reductase [Gammaproteobacteria bacterium]|jgi:enoyl-[acyl-carrier protein] reductase I|nr:enoyl-ACP reductase [Gammaproteobacteria bacterium]MBT5644355.1 enoyl-ACP reductase [Gammaproteobacteria bacterium]MBT5863013.1 enoyl-ACP reductase [Gammaproteobacteria bacterium]MBT6734367.1 enoyl-ACP reductase [Gammaproteobacteria bacterium]|tara:strand:+ start:2479 stop:3249 length:771 start_codon:yes stop_codon:yes gene_type:complete
MNLKNKKVLIIGVASKRSIAASIAQVFSDNGAEIALTYQNEKLKSRVEDIASELSGNSIICPCDLAKDEDISNLKKFIQENWSDIDIIIHSAAFAPRELLNGDFVENITREGFQIAHDISSYSFAALAKEFNDIINENGSMITLSYLGSERVIKNYNVMGLAKASLEANVRYMSHSLGHKNIRVNGISAGPIKTLAASGISGFNEILKHVEDKSALKRNITTVEVANTALFLASQSSSAITGQIIYVDCGFNISGV